MKNTCKILALVLVAMTVIMSLSAITVSAATEPVTMVFESNKLAEAAAGSFTDGQLIEAGTDNFFKLYVSGSTKIDSSSRTWEDGYTSGQRLSLGAGTPGSKNYISFTTPVANATIKIWWASNQKVNKIETEDGTLISEFGAEATKNSAYIQEVTLAAAGTYNLYSAGGANYIFKIEVSWEVELCDHEGGTATCKDLAVCTKCNQPYGELTNDHDFADGVCTVCELPDPNVCKHENMAPATCIAPKTCECGYTEGDALGHDMIVDEAKAPTCTEKGLEEGSHCSRCDYVVAQKEVAALGHTLTFTNTLPTADAAGSIKAHCSVCEADIDFGALNAMTPGSYNFDPSALDNITKGACYDGEVKIPRASSASPGTAPPGPSARTVPI